MLSLRQAGILDVPDEVVRSSTGLAGGGGGKREVCGAVVVIQGIGLRYGRADKSVDRKPAMEQSGKLIEEFRKRFGTLSCHELVKDFPDFNSRERKQQELGTIQDRTSFFTEGGRRRAAKQVQKEIEQMKKVQILAVAFVTLLLSGTSWAHQRGVTEISEGTIRTVYIKKPLVGAKGYVVADWEKGQVRVEVWNFPSSSTGYEAFLFEIDVPKYMAKMFVDGDKRKGLVPKPPPFGEVAGLIKQWHSLGDLKMDHKGHGSVGYRKGDNLYTRGLNMIFIFEKVTPGQHKGPEDTSKLMVECNGPLTGTKGSERMEKALTVFPKK